MQLGTSVGTTHRRGPDYTTDLAVYELEGKEALDTPNDAKADEDALGMVMLVTMVYMLWTDFCLFDLIDPGLYVAVIHVSVITNLLLLRA